MPTANAWAAGRAMSTARRTVGTIFIAILCATATCSTDLLPRDPRAVAARFLRVGRRKLRLLLSQYTREAKGDSRARNRNAGRAATRPLPARFLQQLKPAVSVRTRPGRRLPSGR